MIEHNNRKQADKFAEYITGKQLRQYLADKVHKYAGATPSVFDGACGSGQLEQYINPSQLTAVEIQQASCDALLRNYPSAKVTCDSFFNYRSDNKSDCVVMNPPFSIKFKDLSDIEQANIKDEFAYKKSGVVDDIFVLKGMAQSKRWGFFILFLGVSYRNTEKHFRQLIGNQIVELNCIRNAFDDTKIDVLFLVLDKDKTDSACHRELYDAKTGTVINQDTWQIDSERWECVQEPQAPQAPFDPVQNEADIRQMTVKNLSTSLEQSKLIIDFFGNDSDRQGFDDYCDDIVQMVQACKYQDSTPSEQVA